MELKIFYTGIGSTKSDHTEEEFLTIMKNEFTDKNWENETPKERNLCLLYKEWDLPNDFSRFTLIDWMEYSGANIIFSDV